MLLKRLGEAPPPTALAGIDDAILAAWSTEQRDRAGQSRVLSAAGLVALGLGLAGGSFAGAPANASTSLSPFTSTDLAPSSLLDPHR